MGTCLCVHTAIHSLHIELNLVHALQGRQTVHGVLDQGVDRGDQTELESDCVSSCTHTFIPDPPEVNHLDCRQNNQARVHINHDNGREKTFNNVVEHL